MKINKKCGQQKADRQDTYSKAGLRSCVLKASKMRLSSRNGCFMLMSITTPDSCEFRLKSLIHPEVNINMKYSNVYRNAHSFLEQHKRKAYLAEVLCNTQHALSIQVLYDSFTEVFLPLWRVPDILSYNCTHLRIKVLDKRTQHLIHITRYLLW